MSKILTPEAIRTQIAKGAFKPNMYLTNMSMAYFQSQDKYVAKSLFPILPVQLSTASYYKFSKADLARDNVGRKPQFGKVAPAVMGLNDDSYRCFVDQVIVGLDEISTLDFSRSKAPGVADPRKAKVKFIAEQMNIHLDILFAQNFFKSGVWANEIEGGNADVEGTSFIKFNDDNGDPVKLFNKLGLGVKSYNALKNHPAILERVKFGGSTANPASVNQNVLAQLFGLDKVAVRASSYNAAPLGAEEDMQFICNTNDALLCYTTDTPAIDEATAGYIFTWDMLGDGNFMPTLQFEGEGGTHTEFMEGLIATDMKKTSDDLAIYLHNCI